MDKLRKTAKAAPVIVLVILTVFVFSYLYGGLSIEDLRVVIQEQGVFGQIIYVSYHVVSVVFSPLVSIALWPIALLVYGFWQAVFLSFLGSVMGGMVAFYLAKRFGRPLVKKLVGQEALEKIDEFAAVVGWRAFFILRLLSSNYFDYVSYAAGLTKMSAWAYFIITFFTSSIWTVTVFFILEKAIYLGKIPSLLIIGLFFAVALYGAIQAWKRYSTKKKDGV